MRRFHYSSPLLLIFLLPGAFAYAETSKNEGHHEHCCHEVDRDPECEECGEDEDEEGPFLRFVDDLRCFPWGTCHRDPYEERMETERHDFTQSTTTVGRGVLQLEAGYLYLYKDEGGEVEHGHSTPETLLRFGLSDDIEFRIRWNYGWEYIEDEPHRDSANDTIWSLKLQMTEECGWVPESALEVRSSVPTGGGAFSLERVEAGFSYIYGWKLSKSGPCTDPACMHRAASVSFPWCRRSPQRIASMSLGSPSRWGQS